jgi:hypothetical protein
MKGLLASAALAALVLGVAIPARAGDSEDFAGCDGLRKPKTKDDGMRGVASQPGYGFGFGNPESQSAATIAACTRALTGGKLLPTQTLRQAHLLRARAAAKLRINASAEALADLDEAERAIAGQRGEAFFDRSMGASLDLLRALALVQQGKAAEAVPLADRAADRRPFAVQVQMAAAMIRETARHTDATVDPQWARLVRLQPELGSTLISLETSLGRYDSAIAIARTAPLRAPQLARDEEGADKFAALGRHGTALLAAARAGYDLAYARAATGDAAGARAALDTARATYRQLSGAMVTPAEAARDEALSADSAAAPVATPASGLFAPQERMVEARIALAEGRFAEAEKLAKEQLPFGAPARDLHSAIMQAKGDKGAPAIVPAASFNPAAARRQAIGRLADTLLIAHETPRSVIDYQKSKPNVLAALVGAAFSMGTTLLSGIPKTQGFKETANADGTIVVEYTGSTPSAPMVQEMTLLRAAELARAGSKPGFAIVAREDYTRYLTTTQYGATLSRTPTGHKTVMTIRLLDTPDKAQAQGFEAAAVIDRLGPLYYEANPKT